MRVESLLETERKHRMPRFCSRSRRKKLGKGKEKGGREER